MRISELIMLIVGAILFTVSFFMPDKGKGVAELDVDEERKQIKKLLDESATEAKFRVEEAVDDSVTDGCDKAERALDRLTNEKISAINEYSDTVLDQIKKNHDEVMFLYDMLNNKHAQVKNTAAEVSQITKSVKAVEEKIQPSNGFGYVSPKPERSEDNKGFGYTEIRKPEVSSTVQLTKPASANATVFEPIEPKKTEKTPEKEMPQPKSEKKQANEESASSKKKTPKTKQVVKTPVADSNIDLLFASEGNSANSNDKILELHKAGKSNMAIAKELGLGVGEVKLVIDLFEGI